MLSCGKTRPPGARISPAGCSTSIRARRRPRGGRMLPLPSTLSPRPAFLTAHSPPTLRATPHSGGPPAGGGDDGGSSPFGCPYLVPNTVGKDGRTFGKVYKYLNGQVLTAAWFQGTE